MARDRRDPFRNFNFRILFGALGGAAVVGAVGTLVAVARRKRKKKDPPAEPTSGPRPIEVVGTATAARRTKRAAPGRTRARRKS